MHGMRKEFVITVSCMHRHQSGTRNHAWNDEGVRHYCELYASSSVRQSRVIYVTDFTVGIFEQLTVT